MNDDMGFDEKLKELYGTLYDALSGMADKVNGTLNSKGFQINARRVLAGRLREAAERPDLSWPVLCDALCVSGRKEAVRALAAMVDPKYALTEEQMRDVTGGRTNEWLRELCIIIGKTICEIGDEFGIVSGGEES